MKVSIATMIAGRTEKSEEEILKMMNRTTWITASEAFASGFCDEIEVSADFNKRRATEPKAMWKESAQILNSIFKPKIEIKMTKVANKLGLISEANEESIVAAIQDIQNKKAEADDKLKKMEDELKAAKKACSDMEDAFLAEKKKAEEADEDKKKSEAKNMIEGFAKSGKIKNESIPKWTNMYILDPKGTKELLEELPVNKVANKLPETEGLVTEKELTNVIARTMNDNRNKLKLN